MKQPNTNTDLYTDAEGLSRQVQQHTAPGSATAPALPAEIIRSGKMVLIIERRAS